MKFKTTLFLITILFTIQSASGQSRSGIGFAYGANKALSTDYHAGSGFQLFGDVAVGSHWAIVPNLGYDGATSTRRVVYDQYGFATKRIADLELGYIGASGKYYFNKNWFAKAGATLYIASGSDDIGGLGIGGTGAAGYRLNADNHSSFELSLDIDVVDIQYGGNGVTPIAGLKLAYVFNFKSFD